MEQGKAPRELGKQSGRKSTVEIPPPENREHLTEPTWIEQMIYLAGVYLGEESEEDSDDDKSSKHEAA